MGNVCCADRPPEPIVGSSDHKQLVARGAEDIAFKAPNPEVWLSERSLNLSSNHDEESDIEEDEEVSP